MGTLPKLPEWLPGPVYWYVEVSSQVGKSRESFDLMIRLATDPRMHSVWETLEKHTVTDAYLAHFFINALFNVAYWKNLERHGFRIPASERRQYHQKIREAIDNLIHLLNEHHWMIVEDIRELHALRDRIERAEQFSEHLPTRMRGKTAMRSFFMRVMKDFVLKRFNHPLHQVIADTTNVVFNTDVTPEDVRKA